MAIYLVVGISGVGKSTVVRRGLELAGKSLDIVNFGDLMLEILREEGKDMSRDDLKLLPEEEIVRLQKKVAKRLNSWPDDVILDTHLAIESPEGYVPGIPDWLAQELNLTHIILIEAPAEEIIKRREKDKGKRERMIQTKEELERQMDIDRAMASYLAVRKGIPLKIIENLDLERAASEFARVLEGKE